MPMRALGTLVLASVALVLACEGEEKAPPAAPPSNVEAKAQVEAKPEPAAPPEAKTVAKAEAKPEPPPKARPTLPPESELPGAGIILPPKPTFPTSAAPERYVDGSFSIQGLRMNLEDNVADGMKGTEILVRATVQEIYIPPTCPAGTVCPPSKQPHAWLVDDPAEKGKRRAMLLTNYAFVVPEWDARRWKGIPDVVLEVGKEYTFKGRFKQFSDTGFAHDQGLLEFVAVQTLAADGTKEWVAPVGAPWHPIEVARIEEENARLVEKAAAAAAK